MSGSFYGRPMEILLVEDSQPDAAMTMRALKEGRFRHRLSVTTDGQEALEFLRREGRFARAPRPDLLLLDLQLPRMDGRELLKEIRSDETIAEIPVVVMTSSPDHEELIRAEHLAVEDYLTKPIDPAGFIDLIRRLRDYWRADVVLPVLD
ncbi:MAG: response regulator [Planctomycetales bacterium]|nr:response regulator [Planctomycetales bacterium]